MSTEDYTDYPDGLPDDPRAAIESADERLQSAFTKLAETAATLKADLDRFEAALRKIEGWKHYRGHEHAPLTEYEEGANDAIDTLAKIAREALNNAIDPKF